MRRAASIDNASIDGASIDGSSINDTSISVASVSIPIAAHGSEMHDDPTAFFITWTCYGTWLPGDDRGWTKWHQGDQIPQPILADWCRGQMSEMAVRLDKAQREIVNRAVEDHCNHRNWLIHAVNCRSNHCHVVVTAAEYAGELVRDQFKSWGKRRLKEQRKKLLPDVAPKEKWWTRKGSVRYLFDDESLDAAIMYTLESQDLGGSKNRG